MSHRSDHPTRQLIAHARELSELCRRAMAISEALQALSGVDPADEHRRLHQGAGASALAQCQPTVTALLERAEAAARRAVGPQPEPLNPQRRARSARPFV